MRPHRECVLYQTQRTGSGIVYTENYEPCNFCVGVSHGLISVWVYLFGVESLLRYESVIVST